MEEEWRRTEPSDLATHREIRGKRKGRDASLTLQMLHILSQCMTGKRMREMMTTHGRTILATPRDGVDVKQ